MCVLKRERERERDKREQKNNNIKSQERKKEGKKEKERKMSSFDLFPNLATNFSVILYLMSSIRSIFSGHLFLAFTS